MTGTDVMTAQAAWVPQQLFETTFFFRLRRAIGYAAYTAAIFISTILFLMMLSAAVGRPVQYVASISGCSTFSPGQFTPAIHGEDHYTQARGAHGRK